MPLEPRPSRVFESIRPRSKSWAVFEYRHVVPLDDQREHELFGTCWCKPRVEEPDAELGYIVVHNSADGREKLERIAAGDVVPS